MKISSINYINHTQKQQNFSGLWGKTMSLAPDRDPVNETIRKEEIAYYYPFLGENQKQIDDAIDKNTSSQIVRGKDGERQLLIRNCKVCEPLLIHQDLFKKYSEWDNSGGVNSKLRMAHVFSKDKFINSGFEKYPVEQVSAINVKVANELAKRIDENV